MCNTISLPLFLSHSIELHLSSQSACRLPAGVFCHLSFCHLTCLQSSLTAHLCFFLKPPLWTFFTFYTLKLGRCSLGLSSNLSFGIFPVLIPPLHFPPLHSDSDSAAEIKGRALITYSTKCRPAAQGIGPHYEHRDSQLRAVMTYRAKQTADSSETTLPSLVKPWHRLMLSVVLACVIKYLNQKHYYYDYEQYKK